MLLAPFFQTYFRLGVNQPRGGGETDDHAAGQLPNQGYLAVLKYGQTSLNVLPIVFYTSLFKFM